MMLKTLMVDKLRKETMNPFSICKQALEKTNYNYDEAVKVANKLWEERVCIK